MAKDTLWFPHDFEPTSDPKITAFIGEYGGLGYGVYWRVVEMLHSADGNKLPKKKYIYASIAKQLLTDVDHIENIIHYALNTCELFSEDEEFIWSERVSRNINKMKNISYKNSIAGKKSAEKKALKPSTSVERPSTSVERALNVRQHAFNEVQQIREDKIIVNTNSLSDFRIFDEFRKLYGGTKKGNETEFENFKKKTKDWKEILPQLTSIIKKQIEHRRRKELKKEFVPQWKNLQTWINQRCWEEEIPDMDGGFSKISTGNGYAINPQEYINGTPPQGKFVGKITSDQ